MSDTTKPPPPVMYVSPAGRLQAQRLADLMASVRDIPSLNPLMGIVGGPGNQGSRCTANLQGHAGSPATPAGLPRNLKVGGVGVKP